MRPLASALFALLFLVSLAACDTAEDPIPDEGSVPMVPLEVGAAWTLELVYSVRYFPSSDTPPDTVYHEDLSTVTLTVTRDSLIDGERWFHIESSRPSGLGHPVFCRTNAEWYANRDGGLYRLTPGEEPELVLSSNAEPGVPFIDTPEVAVVLADPEAVYELPGLGAVEARAFERTQRRVSPGSLPEGPVEPNLRSVDYLSSAVGFVALDLPYITLGAEEGTYQPSAVRRYELVSYELP
jgi:hypothetical protein